MKPYQIIPDGIGNPKDFFRPAFCYAHGALECDLNKDGDGQSDYFYLEKRASEIRLHSDCGNRIYDEVKRGEYPCMYKCRKATLYVFSEREGLLCYDDDEQGIEYINEVAQFYNNNND